MTHWSSAGSSPSPHSSGARKHTTSTWSRLHAQKRSSQTSPVASYWRTHTTRLSASKPIASCSCQGGGGRCSQRPGEQPMRCSRSGSMSPWPEVGVAQRQRTAAVSARATSSS